MAERLAMAMAPFWLIGIGAFAGLLILSVAWCVVFLVKRPVAMELLDLFKRPAIRPVLILAVIASTFALFTSLFASFEMETFGFRLFDGRADAIASVLRIPEVGEQTFEVTIDGNAYEQSVPYAIADSELQAMKIDSDQDLRISVNKPESKQGDDALVMKIGSNNTAEWQRRIGTVTPLDGEVREFFISNNSAESATVQFKMTTEIPVPQARAIPITAISLVTYVLSFVFLRFGFRKTSAIAMASCKEAVSQPLFYILLAAGAALMVLLVYMPYFTFGDDVKQFKDSGLTLIIVLSVAFVFWTASSSVADEIEGRTALMVLSKPVGRAPFVIGKYLGIISSVAVFFIVLGSFLLLLTSYKAMYDAGETSMRAYTTWHDCYQHLAQLAPGLALGFLETAVLTSIAVALSTRLAMLPNLFICISIYVVGHILPLLVHSTIGEIALVRFMSQLAATLLPVLEYFNYYGAITSGKSMPLDLFAWTALYAIIYITIALLLALAMFEDRDLA